MHGKNHSEVKSANLEAIKRMLYKSAPISRVQLAEALELTPATITNLTAEMIAKGEVCELDVSLETGKNSGRKPIALDLIADRYSVLGISLGRDSTNWCIADMRGRILAQGSEKPMNGDYAEMLGQMQNLLQTVQTDHAEEWNRLLGIGVSVPGIVSSHEGRIKNHGQERESWVDKPMEADIAKITGLPVRLDNNVRARACAIDLFHPELLGGSSTYAFCHVSWGIACPLVLGERPFRGEDAAAGELGKMKMTVNKNETRTLESLASADSILRACRKRMRSGKETLLTRICPDPDRLLIHHVIDAQQNKDKYADKVLTQAMVYIGIGLANMISIIDPHLVFLSGEVFKSEKNAATVKKTLLEHAFLPKDSGPDIVPVDLGEFGGAIGAAACCIEKHYIRRPV